MTKTTNEAAREISDRRMAALRANGEDVRRTVAWTEALAERAQIERSIAFSNWKAAISK